MELRQLILVVGDLFRIQRLTQLPLVLPKHFLSHAQHVLSLSMRGRRLVLAWVVVEAIELFAQVRRAHGHE